MPLSNKTRPIHPGTYLKTKVLPKRSQTQGQFADELGVGRATVNDLLSERRDISIAMALRLERVLGLPAEKWVQMQLAVDLWDARAREGELG